MEQKQLLQLAQQAAQGSAEALEALWRHKAKDILCICTHIMGSPQDGEDAAQEVFIAMQRGIGGLQSPASFTPWCNRLIANSCKQLLRKNRRHSARLNAFERDKSLLQQEFLPEEYAEQQAMRELVREAMHSLPFRYRAVLVLSYYENNSTADIAQALETNTKGVENLLYRARRALKKEIQKRTGEELAPPTTLGGVLVLTRILHSDMAQVFDEAAMGRVLAIGTAGVAAGAAVNAAAAAATGTTAAFSLMGWVASGLCAAIAALAITLGAASAFPATGPVSPAADPQPAAGAAQAEPAAGNADETIQPEQVEGQPPAESTAQSRPRQTPPATGGGGQVGKGAAEGQQDNNAAPGAGPHADAQPGATEYTGQFVFCTPQGTRLAQYNSLAAGFGVAAYSGNDLLATAYADGDGAFSLSLPGAYSHFTLVATPVYGYGPVSQGGFVAEFAAGGTQLPAVPFTDTQPPYAEVWFTDEEGALLEGEINPRGAYITPHDTTAVQVAWQVQDETGTVVLQGTGGTAALSSLAAPRGVTAYRLVVALTDVVGNTASVEREFVLVNLA